MTLSEQSSAQRVDISYVEISQKPHLSHLYLKTGAIMLVGGNETLGRRWRKGIYLIVSLLHIAAIPRLTYESLITGKKCSLVHTELCSLVAKATGYSSYLNSLI
jgi:hypothetical protein